ncbi:MAG: hypothetical protein U9R58_14055 [Chloroflexota bacterium]|nr:hypothetical protein [Chloroflexota bacterium]
MLYVEICVDGCIDEEWSEWFGELTITHIEGGQSVLSGLVIDQTELYSLIAKLSRLGLPLVSVVVSEATENGQGDADLKNEIE